ncbi:hypothetical protein C4566_03580 [Candidatus Parcubacteria bacterium]|nr:MAG: hypothetical protein C4566_03580 [Candidatus Parcubacteria bacterium]
MIPQNDIIKKIAVTMPQKLDKARQKFCSCLFMMFTLFEINCYFCPLEPKDLRLYISIFLN